jgi:hypothetical protein
MGIIRGQGKLIKWQDDKGYLLDNNTGNTIGTVRGHQGWLDKQAQFKARDANNLQGTLGGPAGQPITNQPATKSYIANTAKVPGSDYAGGWNNLQERYGIKTNHPGMFDRMKRYDLTDDQYNQMKSDPYLSLLEETSDYRDIGY